MSLAEIEEAVDKLSLGDLTKLAAHIARRHKLAWVEELEEDFSPGGNHEKALKKIDAEIDSGNFTPLPRGRTQCDLSGDLTSSFRRTSRSLPIRISHCSRQIRDIC